MPRDRRRRDKPVRVKPLSGPTLAGRRIASARDWRWRTFPVFFTFSTTLFVAVALQSIGLGFWLLLIGAVCFAAALSHLVSVRFIGPRLKPPVERRRPEDRAP